MDVIQVQVQISGGKTKRMKDAKELITKFQRTLSKASQYVGLTSKNQNLFTHIHH